jgi:hypothetical protein
MDHTALYTSQTSFDGQYPGQVVFGPNGALFGTAASGGTPGVLCHSNLRIKYGCGTVFQLTSPSEKGGSWTTVLYTSPGYTHDGIDGWLSIPGGSGAGIRVESVRRKT